MIGSPRLNARDVVDILLCGCECGCRVFDQWVDDWDPGVLIFRKD